MWSRSVLLAAAVAITLAGIIPLANFLTDGPGLIWYGAAAKQWLLSTSLIVAFAVGIAALGGARVDTALTRLNGALLRLPARAFGFSVAAVGAGLAGSLATFAFHRQIFAGDEMSQRFQARVVASGHLAARTEELPEFFSSTEALDAGGRWFSQFPIGTSFFAAPFMALGIEWIVNPLLVGVACYAVYRFASRATDEVTARWTAVLFLCSPFVLFMGASQMNHVPALAMIWIGIAGVAAWSAASTARALAWSAAVTGFAFGMAATVRPYDAVLLALPAGLLQVWTIRANAPESRLRLRSLAWQLAGGLVPVLVLLYANWQTTGSALLFGYDALNGPEHRPGFHVTPPGFVHSVTRGVYQVSAYLLRLNISLFESPVPALLFVIAALALLTRATRWDVLMLSMILTTLIGYAAYWHEGYFMTAPRFLYAVAPAFLWFVARAPRAVADRIARPLLRRAVLLVVPLSVLLALVMPLDLRRLGGVWTRLAGTAASQPKLRPNVREAVRTAGIHSALVFVNESWHGQLAARLRRLGMRPIPANMLVAEVDACALQTALDAEDSLPAASDAARLQRVVERAAAGNVPTPPVPFGRRPPDEALAFVPGRELTPVCKLHLEREKAGTLPFATFLAEQRFDGDGRLSGDVVFARDLVERNERLRKRFGDRSWYRLSLVQAGSGFAIRVEPYGQ